MAAGRGGGGTCMGKGSHKGCRRLGCTLLMLRAALRRPPSHCVEPTLGTAAGSCCRCLRAGAPARRPLALHAWPAACRKAVRGALAPMHVDQGRGRGAGDALRSGPAYRARPAVFAALRSCRGAYTHCWHYFCSCHDRTRSLACGFAGGLGRSCAPHSWAPARAAQAPAG